MDERTFTWATVADLGTALRNGSTTPTELATHAINRLERIGRELNAVVTMTPELAMAQAKQAEADFANGIDRGPLQGIPWGAKDLLATSGIPTSWGARPYADQVFDSDSAVVEKLRDAGAVLVAKLAMVELAGGFGYEQPNAALTGPGRSAWDRESWAGGSSSGSGAAVGAGCVPFAIGTETWGSIHCPAAFNGITGLRPTYGRVSRRGAMALSWTMDKIGPMARTVSDCIAVYDVIAGPDRGDPATLHAPVDVPSMPAGKRPRLGVLKASVGASQPGVAAAFDAALKVLAEFADLEEVSLPELPFDEAASIVVMCEAASAFQEFIDQGHSHELTAPEDQAGLYHGLTIPATDYLRALRIRRLAMRQMDSLLERVDALVAPTFPFVASPIGESYATYFARDAVRTLGAAGNLCGLPSISVPCGFAEKGLPAGLEILSRAYDEARVLTIASAFEARTDWHQRHPEWCA